MILHPFLHHLPVGVGLLFYCVIVTETALFSIPVAVCEASHENGVQDCTYRIIEWLLGLDLEMDVIQSIFLQIIASNQYSIIMGCHHLYGSFAFVCFYDIILCYQSNFLILV